MTDHTGIGDILAAIRDLARELPTPVTLMEVCGTHTMAIHRHGLVSLMPATVKLRSGPGCPVCVTPSGYIDLAVALAKEDGDQRCHSERGSDARGEGVCGAQRYPHHGTVFCAEGRRR